MPDRHARPERQRNPDQLEGYGNVPAVVYDVRSAKGAFARLHRAGFIITRPLLGVWANNTIDPLLERCNANLTEKIKRQRG